VPVGPDSIIIVVVVVVVVALCVLDRKDVDGATTRNLAPGDKSDDGANASVKEGVARRRAITRVVRMFKKGGCDAREDSIKEVLVKNENRKSRSYDSL
jgi:hypothetical protein